MKSAATKNAQWIKEQALALGSFLVVFQRT